MLVLTTTLAGKYILMWPLVLKGFQLCESPSCYYKGIVPYYMCLLLVFQMRNSFRSMAVGNILVIVVWSSFDSCSDLETCKKSQRLVQWILKPFKKRLDGSIHARRVADVACVVLLHINPRDCAAKLFCLNIPHLKKDNLHKYALYLSTPYLRGTSCK